jgi:hypothetical protein
MAHPYRDRRFLWMIPWFVIGGVCVTYAIMALDSLGAAMSKYPNDKPSGIAPFLFEVGPYCAIGAIACCIRTVKVRASLALIAHIVTFVIGAICGPKVSVTYGLFLCGTLLIPFGLAWIVLLMDLFPNAYRKLLDN